MVQMMRKLFIFVLLASGVLACGGLAMDELARRFGTPLYAYDAALIEDRYTALVQGIELQAHVYPQRE